MTIFVLLGLIVGYSLTEGCEYPTPPLYDVEKGDFLYCHPKYGPTCPSGSFCSYRWLGYYICCEHVDKTNLTGPFRKETAKLSTTRFPQNDFVISNNISGTAQLPLPTVFTVEVPTVSFVASGKFPPADVSAVLRSTPDKNLSFDAAITSTVGQTEFPKVTVLQEGDWVRVSDTKFQFPSSVVLIEDGSWLVLVDTGVPMDRSRLLDTLENLNVKPDMINFLILTHGHPDHFGNTGLFPTSVQYFGTFMYRGSTFTTTDLLFKDTLQLTPNVELRRSPGHTTQDISIIVRRVNGTKTVAVAGDLFINESDIDLPEFWTIVSSNPSQQAENRKLVLCGADMIIPGHGKMFPVTPLLKNKFDCERSSGKANRIVRT